MIQEQVIHRPTVAAALSGRESSLALDEQLALEGELQTAATKTADFTEGVTAFREKRPPTFTGR